MKRYRHRQKRHRYRAGRSLYRSRRGVIFGVCRGLADYFDFNVVWIRVIFIIILLCGFLVSSPFIIKSYTSKISFQATP